MWTVPPTPELLWETLGMGENPTQQPNIYSFPPSEKSPLIDLNLLLQKFHFFPITQQFSSYHPRKSFAAAVISVVLYFKFQALSTHMSC